MSYPDDPWATDPGTIYPERLAWAAGFFDGEGHAGCTDRGPRNRGPRFALFVVQYDERPIRRFQSTVWNLGYVSIGKARPPYGKNPYTWAAQSYEHAQAVAVLLWPWLSEPKREQIYAALVRYHELRRPLMIRRWRHGV